jgi:hypothetical protein
VGVARLKTMDRLIEVLNAVAATSDDGTPDYEVELNGLIVRVKVDTREGFATASAAVDHAQEVARKLLAADDYVAVSAADIGATVTTLLKRRGAVSTDLWRGRLSLVLVATPLDEHREVTFTLVTGLTD